MLEQLKGQPRAAKLLKRAMSGGRLAHAFLFSGPDGVGKTTAAKEIAQTLLCSNGPSYRSCDTAHQTPINSPCGVCSGCIRFQSGNHPDFLCVSPEGAAIKINQIRQLKEAVTYPPMERRRIILLLEIQTMRREAANSLLKLLEEPPPNNYFFLIGTSTRPLLSTIISRCQVVPFTSLPMKEAAAVIAGAQGELSPAEAEMMAMLSEGCPGQALTMQTGGLFELFGEIREALLSDHDTEENQVEAALGAAARVSGLKEELPLLLQLLRRFFRDLLRQHLEKPDQRINIAEQVKTRDRWNLEEVSAKMNSIDFAERALAGNCNRGLVCEVLFLDLFEQGKHSS